LLLFLFCTVAARAELNIGAVLSTGRIALNGSGDELLQDPRVRAVYLGV
jgi:ABC-type branched-subunit amino acid transport system ATPase component